MDIPTTKKLLKIYYGYTGSTTKRPFIRLCGKYLNEMDYKIGERVEIVVSKNQITITKVPLEDA